MFCITVLYQFVYYILSQQASQLKCALEQAEHAHTESIKKCEKLTTDYQKIQEYSNHQKSQLESQNEKIRSLETDLKRFSGVQNGSRDRPPTSTAGSDGRNIVKVRSIFLLLIFLIFYYFY